MKEGKSKKKQGKHVNFLKDELAALDKMTVNDQTEDTMKRAAPDTYFTIHTYLTRRLQVMDADNG